VTDLEMTKLCAEAMGYKLVYPDESYLPVCIEGKFGAGTFSPLHDDAQAMALVKKFGLYIWWWCEGVQVMNCGPGSDNYKEWLHRDWPKYEYNTNGYADINRAIVECVAKMQKAK
jgi:hypothetical protein